MIAVASILFLSVAVIAEASPLTCSSVQGCSTWDWVKCAGVVAQCAAECSKGITSQSCISCLGDSYSECKDCFSLALEIKTQETIMQKIQASNSADCTRWDWMKCAGAAHSAQCSTECMKGLTSGACTSFLGTSYDECSNCFSLVEKIKRIDSSIQGCSAWDWVKCAGVVAQCAAECSEGITSQSCISCLGDSYNQCKDCFLADEIMAQDKNTTNILDVGSWKSNDFDAHIEGCSALEWAACAAVVTGCAAVCTAAEVDAPACIACMGGSYSTCKNCV